LFVNFVNFNQVRLIAEDFMNAHSPPHSVVSNMKRCIHMAVHHSCENGHFYRKPIWIQSARFASSKKKTSKQGDPDPEFDPDEDIQ